MESVISGIMSVGQVVITSLLVYYIKRTQNKCDKEAQERSRLQAQATILQLKMSSACNSLAYAVAVAVRRGKANGEVEHAIEEYAEAKVNYDLFMAEQATHFLQK